MCSTFLASFPWFIAHPSFLLLIPAFAFAVLQEALDASVGVLRSLSTQRISARDLVRAQRTLLTRHESDTKVRRVLQVADSAIKLHAICSYRKCRYCRKRVETFHIVTPSAR